MANPQCRTEGFLKSILNGSNVPDPECRLEVYLKAIRDALQGGGSSGGGALYVTTSQDMALDKNFEEIQAALDSGKVVMAKGVSFSETVYIPLTKAVSTSDPENPYYGVAFYNYDFQKEVFFSNTTGPTDPLVFEQEESQPIITPEPGMHE